MSKITRILTNLAVGPGHDTYEFLKDYSPESPTRIAVLNVADDYPEPSHHRSLLYVHPGLTDGPVDHSAPYGHDNSERAYLNAIWALDALLKGGYEVYVHCHGGVSRSVFIVTMYLAWGRVQSLFISRQDTDYPTLKDIFDETYKEICVSHTRSNIHPKHFRFAEPLLETLERRWIDAGRK